MTEHTQQTTIHPEARNILEDFALRLSRRAQPIDLGWLGQMATRECVRTIDRANRAAGYNNGRSVA